MCCFTDYRPTLTSIIRLKSQLSDLIEPDFGLLDQLLHLGALTRKQYDDVHGESRVAWERSAAILDFLTSEDQCDKFLKALQRTEQQHVVNFITQNGGQNNNQKLTILHQLNVISDVGYISINAVDCNYRKQNGAIYIAVAVEC